MLLVLPPPKDALIPETFFHQVLRNIRNIPFSFPLVPVFVSKTTARFPSSHSPTLKPQNVLPSEPSLYSQQPILFSRCPYLGFKNPSTGNLSYINFYITLPDAPPIALPQLTSSKLPTRTAKRPPPRDSSIRPWLPVPRPPRSATKPRKQPTTPSLPRALSCPPTTRPH